MSSLLVKKSLSLFEDDLNEEPVKKKKKAKEPMSAISTKKRGVKKELERLQKQEQKKSRRKTPQSSLRHNNYTDGGNYDYTDTSVEILNRISQLDSANRNATSMVTKHHQKKKKKKAAKSADAKKQDETSAFSEKDFEQFSKEFDFSKLKKS